MGIGKRIRDKRAELKISSTELAEKIHVSKQTISGYEVLQCDANYLYQDFIDTQVLKKEQNGLTDQEFELIRKYRLLNDHGKFVVESIANIEYDRMLDGLEKQKKSFKD